MQDEYGISIEDLPYSSEFNISYYISSTQPPKFGNILCISDPSQADILLDGVLLPQKTSITLIDIPIGSHDITFTKGGHLPYSDRVVVKQGQTVTVATILTKTVDIIDNGIVICAGSNILACPVSPITCPITTTPLDYINLIVILNATSASTLTVRFVYTLDSITNYTDVSVNLSIGTNVIYAFPTNNQYPGETILSLEDVILV